MHVRATRRSATAVTRDGDVEVHPAAALRTLLPETVALVIAVPSAPDTRGLIGAAELALLPRPAVVVNVARADIVDEDALYDALRGSGLAAGLDVWWTEAQQLADAEGVIASRHPFQELENVVLSPHRAGGFALPEVQALQRQHLAALLPQLVGDD
jgi:phosphoglycerate dehydrogenase-like enzyme